MPDKENTNINQLKKALFYLDTVDIEKLEPSLKYIFKKGYIQINSLRSILEMEEDN